MIARGRSAGSARCATRSGEGPELYVDANCSLDAFHAEELARRIEPCGIAFFEEPVTQNDMRLLADLRSRIRIPIAAGQNEGLAWRFRDLLADPRGRHPAAERGDQRRLHAMRCASPAWRRRSTCRSPTAARGRFHNMHLHAGLANGGLVEYHYPAVQAAARYTATLPEPEDGWLDLPERPGLGFEPDEDALREMAKRPTARGRSKG